MKTALAFSLLTLINCGYSHAANVDAVCTTRVGLSAAELSTRLMLFGEIHGTREAPRYVGDVACAALRHNEYRQVIVALEYPQAEESSLLAFFHSDGLPRDRVELIATSFWQREVQDGRSSNAMFGLIDRLRRMHQTDRRLKLAAIDPLTTNTEGRSRDELMALRLVEVATRAPGTLTVALVGNVHAKRTRGLHSDPGYKTMASEIAMPFRTYAFVAHGGSYWACVTLCGEQQMAHSDEFGLEPTLDLAKVLPSINYDGLVNLGVITAAMPTIVGDGKGKATP